MKLTYHHYAIDLLGIEPILNPEIEMYISDFEARESLIIPAAIKEWYCIKGSNQAVRDILAPNETVPMTEWEIWIKEHSSGSSKRQLLPVIFENQSVWHMTIPLDRGQNPPVLIRFSDEQEGWQIHSRNFSDCILGLAWDYMILQNGFQMVSISAAKKSKLLETLRDRVECQTSFASARFIASKFIRFRENNILNTLVVSENEARILKGK